MALGPTLVNYGALILVPTSWIVAGISLAISRVKEYSGFIFVLGILNIILAFVVIPMVFLANLSYAFACGG